MTISKDRFTSRADMLRQLANSVAEAVAPTSPTAAAQSRGSRAQSAASMADEVRKAGLAPART